MRGIPPPSLTPCQPPHLITPAPRPRPSATAPAPATTARHPSPPPPSPGPRRPQHSTLRGTISPPLRHPVEPSRRPLNPPVEKESAIPHLHQLLSSVDKSMSFL